MARRGKDIPSPGFLDTMKGRPIRYHRKGELLLAAGIFLILLMLNPWADELTETNLIFHMFAEHPAFLLGAVISSFGLESLVLSMIASGRRTGIARTITFLYTRAVLANSRVNAKGRVALPVIAGILVFWHIPNFFDMATLNPPIHALFHFSTIVVGILFFLNLKVLSKIDLVKYLIIFDVAMDIYGRILMGITTPIRIYSAYPLSQQVVVGQVMFLSMIVMLPVLIIYGIVLLIKSDRFRSAAPSVPKESSVS